MDATFKKDKSMKMYEITRKYLYSKVEKRFFVSNVVLIRTFNSSSAVGRCDGSLVKHFAIKSWKFSDHLSRSFNFGAGACGIWISTRIGCISKQIQHNNTTTQHEDLKSSVYRKPQWSWLIGRKQFKPAFGGLISAISIAVIPKDQISAYNKSFVTSTIIILVQVLSKRSWDQEN